MSRGPGRIERACLDAFEFGRSKWLTTREITAWVGLSLSRPESNSLASSIRRALAALRKRGVLLSQQDSEGVTLWTIAEKERRRQSQKRRRAEQKQKKWEQADREEAEWLRELTKAREKAESEIERLAKLLGMLGSDHDGEVLNAARRAEEKRREMGKSWQELLRA